MKHRTYTPAVTFLVALMAISLGLAQGSKVTNLKKWRQGAGWGWVWGADDEHHQPVDPRRGPGAQPAVDRLQQCVLTCTGAYVMRACRA